MDIDLWIVTGNSGSGKTTFCQGILQFARSAGLHTAGIISPAVFRETVSGEDKTKESIWAESIQSGEKRILASVNRRNELDLAFGEWFFDQKTLEWGNQVLKTSIPCDLLLIDELGPIEFNLSRGWMSAMDVIKSAQYRLAVVVIRPHLLEIAQRTFQPTRTIEITEGFQVQRYLEMYLPSIKKIFQLP